MSQLNPGLIQALHPNSRRVFPAGFTCAVSQDRLWPLGPAEHSPDTNPVQGVGHQLLNPMSQHFAAQVPSPGHLFSWKKTWIFHSLELPSSLPRKSLRCCPTALGMISKNKKQNRRSCHQQVSKLWGLLPTPRNSGRCLGCPFPAHLCLLPRGSR